MISIKEIYKLDLKGLALVFFNITKQDKDRFEVKISYRTSTHATKDLDKNITEKNNELLSKYSNLDFEVKGIGQHVAYIENENNISFEEFMINIFSLIQQKRFTYSSSEFDGIVLNSAFGPRGSIDLKRNYLTIDIYERFISDKYIEMIMNLLISTEATNQLNLNFRNLQKQYVEQTNKRNTQIRINLKWFAENYIDYLSEINTYKEDIIKNNRAILAQNSYTKKNSSFLERMIFYKEKIVNSNFSFDQLSKPELKRQVEELREELDFSEKPDNELRGIKRNKQIVAAANTILPEECVCCKDMYNVEDRTFKRKDSERYYFELHHVISFGSNQSGDILENLVKVCPACHRALTPNRANEDYQKELIKNILLNSKEANKYVENFIQDPTDYNMKIEYVFANLK
ncbi:HNH endonuclease [Staphylococcus epidermidis]|uniref:HNH endonuclease signature motif containing protein n=1 Tax=Staphylococcus epidermidis TaxID=1282 RepID=UPI0005C267C5|nr:HNH endonuclease signature motif containing protein [Staphylococcus epidermidis]AJP25494.1 hypothetical protein UC17_08985 [Staphylococcus epidermidis]MBM0754476.1 HNH endonuclease [Staphylococcus epidermidis]MBM0816554.1 HNH endonuclease [Staphylococcus epidermidis]MCO6287777.1 HNH endonuclease [Staphylococcus epidermidis]MDS3935243.1 HNH endonuclease signature motif containing protein [Staphylococcus epidermidis]